MVSSIDPIRWDYILITVNYHLEWKQLNFLIEVLK
jgi:hypothetical protein